MERGGKDGEKDNRFKARIVSGGEGRLRSPPEALGCLLVVAGKMKHFCQLIVDLLEVMLRLV